MLWDPTTNGMARMKNMDCSEPFVDVWKRESLWFCVPKASLDVIAVYWCVINILIYIYIYIIYYCIHILLYWCSLCYIFILTWRFLVAALRWRPANPETPEGILGGNFHKQNGNCMQVSTGRVMSNDKVSMWSCTKDKDRVPLARNASRCASRFARSDTSRQLDKLLQHWSGPSLLSVQSQCLD